MNSTDNLMKVAMLFMEHNPNAILSGSLALKLQNIPLAKEPSDVDLFVFGPAAKIPTEFKPDYLKGQDYEEEDYERSSYIYKIDDSIIPIDIFNPIDGTMAIHEMPYFDARYNDKWVKVVQPWIILGFKIKHYHHTGQDKHRNGISKALGL